jgi:hypothetical protein
MSLTLERKYASEQSAFSMHIFCLKRERPDDAQQAKSKGVILDNNIFVITFYVNS